MVNNKQFLRNIYIMIKKSVMGAVSEVKRIHSSPLSMIMTSTGISTGVFMYANESYKGNDPILFPYIIGGLTALIMSAYIFGESD